MASTPLAASPHTCHAGCVSTTLRSSIRMLASSSAIKIRMGIDVLLPESGNASVSRAKSAQNTVNPVPLPRLVMPVTLETRLPEWLERVGRVRQIRGFEAFRNLPSYVLPCDIHCGSRAPLRSTAGLDAEMGAPAGLKEGWNPCYNHPKTRTRRHPRQTRITTPP